MKLYASNPGATPMSEPITVTYMDLDALIDACEFTESEEKVIDLLMRGWTKSDIAELFSCPSAIVGSWLDAAVEKILEQNEYRWHRCQAARRKLQ